MDDKGGDSELELLVQGELAGVLAQVLLWLVYCRAGTDEILVTTFQVSGAGTDEVLVTASQTPAGARPDEALIATGLALDLGRFAVLEVPRLARRWRAES